MVSLYEMNNPPAGRFGWEVEATTKRSMQITLQKSAPWTYKGLLHRLKDCYYLEAAHVLCPGFRKLFLPDGVE